MSVLKSDLRSGSNGVSNWTKRVMIDIDLYVSRQAQWERSSANISSHSSVVKEKLLVTSSDLKWFLPSHQPLSYAWSRVGIPRWHDLERTNYPNPILQMGRIWIFHRRLIVVTGEVVSRLVYDSTLLESNKPISPKFLIDLTPESSGFPWVESIPLMAQEFS